MLHRCSSSTTNAKLEVIPRKYLSQRMFRDEMAEGCLAAQVVQAISLYLVFHGLVKRMSTAVGIPGNHEGIIGAGECRDVSLYR
jgi:hypothetical protein